MVPGEGHSRASTRGQGRPDRRIVPVITIRTPITDERRLQFVPIDLDRFENPQALDHRPTSERVVRFLLEHDDRAYTRREIADAIGAEPETVGTNLTRLKDRGLVRHREPYWAIGDDRDRIASALRDRYGDAVADELLASDGPNHGEESIAAQEARRPDDRDDPDTGGDTDGAVDGEDRDGGGGGDGQEDGHDSDASARNTTRRPSTHYEAASAFVERVRDRLGTSVDDVYLFGSVATGTATPESDVDVLVVVSSAAEYLDIDDQLLEIAYDVQLDHGVRIEVHSLTADELEDRRARGDPFVRTVLEEGASVG